MLPSKCVCLTFEGERILEFGDAVGMVVCNTFFKKED